MPFGAALCRVCAPHHRNEREAPSRGPHAVAFALSPLAWGPIWAHAGATHPDLAAPRSELERNLSRAKERQRFTGFASAYDSSEHRGGPFFANFERGQDRSFAELSVSRAKRRCVMRRHPPSRAALRSISTPSRRSISWPWRRTRGTSRSLARTKFFRSEHAVRAYERAPSAGIIAFRPRRKNAL